MKEIIQFIDDYLENNNLESISAVDANRLLDEKGLLKDSDSRKGLPLRKKLRNGEIPHAYQTEVFWRIPSSMKSNKTTKTVSPLYNKTMPDKSIRFNSDYSISESENELIEMTYFKDAKNISERDVPESPGLYCIRLKNTNDFPVAFNQYFSEIMNAIIYIGMASKNLRKRLYSQELHAKGHGTFFRSLGAVLGFMPPKGLPDTKYNVI